MTSPVDVLTQRVQAALGVAFGEEYADADPLIRPSQFADYQANVAMSLAKRLGRSPRDVAAALVEHLEIGDVCEPVEVSGPGFLNLRLRDGWLSDVVGALGSDPRFGVPTQERLVVPIDYSAPNVAKEMHVGHLRTTVVGDALARVLEHLGHDVIRQNHIGDWGTPFGMLIEHLLDVGEESSDADQLRSDPNAFYQAAREKFEGDAVFADGSLSGVVRVLGGEAETLRLWQELVDLSKTYFNLVYGTLGVGLRDEHLAGESTYNDDLAAVCDELEAAGIATMSDGALCVFLDGYLGREGKPVPLIIRKSDGGYGYGTTDLATVRHRVRDLHADRMLYVIGAPQSLHLQMVWATARLAGWLPDSVEVVHVQIGNVLGPDRKILKTRSGAPLRLTALLEEAVDKARAVVDEARPDLPDELRAEIAPQVGIGAVKYADLSVAHDTEYVFDLERMVALTGNTGPYLQYAAARVRSILRSAGDVAPGPVVVGEEAEHGLALALLGFGDVAVQVGDSLEPHRLCGYLFELAQAFSVFYESCPVLKGVDDATRASRLALCRTTLDVLVTGLDLLGISSPDRM